MGDWRRHAIYFAPARGSALARFGAEWLGWDPEAGRDVPRRVVAGVEADVVAAPARYGFHATLKAPFRLADGLGEAELDSATDEAVTSLPGFSLRLRVARLGSFVALVPVAVPPELTALEAALVARLDRFRAPLTEAEIARRRPERLGAEERENLARWGYPFVGRRFRFHMTLTGPLPPEKAERVRSVLDAALALLLSEPVPVMEVSRFGEAPDGRFRLVRRFPLAR